MAGNRLLALMGSPAPDPMSQQEWWKQVPPEQRDWWTRRLNAMPYANTDRFQDKVFQNPPAEGTRTLEFDRNTITPDQLLQQQQQAPPIDPRFR